MKLILAARLRYTEGWSLHRVFQFNADFKYRKIKPKCLSRGSLAWYGAGLLNLLYYN